MNHNTVNVRPAQGLLLLCMSMLLFSTVLNASDGKRERLVTSEWLQQHLGDPGLVILDASPATVYTGNHIPGAINYDIFTYGVKEFPVEEIEKRYQSWGISPEKKVILYDQGGSYLATRLFFSLEYYGFPVERIFILDGGFAKWKASGYPVTGQPTTKPAKGTFSIQQLNREIRVDLPEFLEASGNTRDNVLLEALDPAWHYGKNQFFGRPGHIPNAVMLPAEDFYNADKTFKSDEEIRKILSYLGITPEKNVLSHCGGGIAASVPFFALKHLLGYANVKLFPGSLLEWAADQRELPLWTYDAPYLLRDAAWLQGWGGRMMRMYGVSNVNFIDIRQPDAFSRGHVQYATNIPAAIFREHFLNPHALSGVLGQSGVDAVQEVVIFSGGGLTPDAALAYLLHESAGQHSTSLYLDPAENWAASGFTILNDSLTADNKKEPSGKPVQGKPYIPAFRKEIIIIDTGFEGKSYPIVYIASGKQVPGLDPGKPVVHLPYHYLLKSDGRPLPAKEIWQKLSEAGVPRYAELVCYSDDPGEAAVNYFILKLMGFPKIKVLIRP